VHLCGNPGRTDKVIEWVREHLSCFPYETTHALKIHGAKNKFRKPSPDENDQERILSHFRETITQKRILTEKNMLMLVNTVDMPVNESQRFII